MSYNPPGTATPARFKKKTATTGNTFKQRPKDRLCIVDRFEIGDRPDKSRVFVTEIKDNRKIECRIDTERSRTQSISGLAGAEKWSGSAINEKMEKAFPPGSGIVLEQCITEKNIKNGPDGDISLMACTWISSVSDPSPEKAFTGKFTVNAYKDVEAGTHRIVGVQHWNDRAICPSSEEGEALIEDLCQKMDATIEPYFQKKYPITWGAMFRTLVLTGQEESGRNVYQMVDCTPAFDYIRREVDSEGNEIRPGQPMDSQHLTEYLEGYLDYVYGSQDQSAEGAEPGLTAAGIIPADAQFVVEVLPYRAFAASPLSKKMDITNDRTPLHRLANIMTKNGQLDDFGSMGKNWCVDGILVLTQDGAPKQRGGDWIERNMANRLFTSGYTANLHTMIEAFDGGKVTVHPALDRVMEDRAEAAPAAPAAAPASTASGVALQAATQSLAFDDEDDGAQSYFAGALSQVSDVADTAEEEDDGLPSFDPPAKEEAPVAAPAVEAKPVADKKPAAAGGRFRRTT